MGCQGPPRCRRPPPNNDAIASLVEGRSPILLTERRDLLLALPVSWKGTLVQYTGRLHRLHPGKTEVRIYDYVDHEVPMLLRMFEGRLRGYRATGYGRGEAPLGLVEAIDEAQVEYDHGRSRATDTLDIS